MGTGIGFPAIRFQGYFSARPNAPVFSGRRASSDVSPLPTIEMHDGVHVVRDDLLPGGTKSRFLQKLFEKNDEVVYPSCTWGGAQLALACAAKAANKKAVIFVPRRKELHPRTVAAIRACGANPAAFMPGVNGQLVLDSPNLKVIQVPMGFLSVLRARAKEYAEGHPKTMFLEAGAKSVWAEEEIAKAARDVEQQYGPFDEVWCAAGSGTLARGLQRGFQDSRTKFYAVEVAMPVDDLGKATVIRHEKKLSQPLKKNPAPFPSDPHYDGKAWEICQSRKGRGKILFWNVMGDL